MTLVMVYIRLDVLWGQPIKLIQVVSTSKRNVEVFKGKPAPGAGGSGKSLQSLCGYIATKGLERFPQSPGCRYRLPFEHFNVIGFT